LSAPTTRSQLEIVTQVTSAGTWYSVRNLTAASYQYLVIDLTGDREYEIVQASFITQDNYAHYGRLFIEWEEPAGEAYQNELQAGYFTGLDPFTLKRTVRVSGPCKLIFRSFLDGAVLAYFNAFIRVVPKEKGGGVRWW